MYFGVDVGRGHVKVAHGSTHRDVVKFPAYCTTGRERDLAEEISPFTIEEALQVPTHYAINVAKVDNKYHRFLAKMAVPPLNKQDKDWRHKRVDRSHRTKECSRQYGQPVDEVEADIYRREKILYQEVEGQKKKRKK